MLLGEHAVLNGRPCLVTAVNQRMQVTMELLHEPVLELEAQDVEVTGYKKVLPRLGHGEVPKGARFTEHAVKNFIACHPIPGRGVRVITQSQFKSTFGFGSSSAVAVCVVAGLSELLGLRISRREIFDIAYRTVLDVQGKGSGFDVAAAVYGGTLYFQNGGHVIETLEAEGLPLIVGYTGVKADTVTVMEEVKKRFENKQDELNELYGQMGELVTQAKGALESRDWKKAGELMNQDQELLEKLGVSSPKLDAMIAAARSAGAYGAKLSGAGVGDCMIALAPKEKSAEVKKAIEEAGGQVIEVGVNAEGVRLD